MKGYACPWMHTSSKCNHCGWGSTVDGGESDELCTKCGRAANEVENIVVDGEVYCDDDCAPPLHPAR